MMRVRRAIFACALWAAALACLPVAADFELARWAKWREVVGDNTASEFALLRLDGPVFAGAADDLRDLRVVDEQGRETPSKLIIASEQPRAEDLPLAIIDRAEADDRSLFTLDLGERAEPHNRINLDLAAGNFARRVLLEASDDNRRWATVRGDAYVVGFSGVEQASFAALDYPTSTRRYLRVTIFNRGEAPLTLNGASVLRQTAPGVALEAVPAQLSAQEEDKQQRATVLVLDLGWRAMPSARVEAQTAATNFRRRVELAGSQDRQVWSPITSGYFFDISLDRARPRRELALDYPDARLRYLRLTVFNLDDQPLKFDAALVTARPHRLLFRRRVGARYRLFYGNPTAVAPQYDLAQLSSHLTLTELPQLALAAEQTNNNATPAHNPSWLEQQPLWLWAPLAAAVLVLGRLIYRLARLKAE